MTGRCFWEKTTNGCKNKEDIFKHDAYDFYALCRKGEQKEAEYQCKGKPAALKVGQCKNREKPPKGIKHEHSSQKEQEYDSEYHDYYYLQTTTDKKYCYDCEQSAWLWG